MQCTYMIYISPYLHDRNPRMQHGECSVAASSRRLLLNPGKRSERGHTFFCESALPYWDSSLYSSAQKSPLSPLASCTARSSQLLALST